MRLFPLYMGVLIGLLILILMQLGQLDKDMNDNANNSLALMNKVLVENELIYDTLNTMVSGAISR